MRETDWSPARGPEDARLERPGFAAAARAGLGQTLVSGDVAAALAALAPGAPLLGLYAAAPEGPHALRAARDRALLVTPAPLGAAEGWRGGGEGGWCATGLDDGYAVVEVEGPEAGRVLMQGTEADLEAGSPSAVVLFAGRPAFLVRTGAGFRLHIQRMWFEALFAWLDGA